MGTKENVSIAKHLSLETLSKVITELNEVELPRDKYTSFFMLDFIEVYNERVRPEQRIEIVEV